jgi:hypothetical protein
MSICKRQTTIRTKPGIRAGNAGFANWATLEHGCAIVDAVMLKGIAWNGTVTAWA